MEFHLLFGAKSIYEIEYAMLLVIGKKNFFVHLRVITIFPKSQNRTLHGPHIKKNTTHAPA